MRNAITIGRFFAEEWQQALNNEGSFYTAPASSSMTLDELKTLKAILSDLIDYWNNQVFSNTAEDAILNAQAIADLQQSKLDKVNELILAKGGTVETSEESSTSDPATTGKNYLPLILIGGGIGALLLFKRNKNVSGMKNKNLLWLLLIGGGALYLMNKKPAVVLPEEEELNVTDPLATNNLLIAENPNPMNEPLPMPKDELIIFEPKEFYAVDPIQYRTASDV